MRKWRNIVKIVVSASAMIFLLLNTKDAFAFASDGVKLCAASLIPSLFPFIFLSILLNSSMQGYPFSCLRFISSLCRIPAGSESLFLLGLLGGYPVGAQVISNTYQSGNINKKDAERMLGFCNNAGPSFIFGILGPLFHSALVPALLWGIQILSAVMTGVLLKGCCSKSIHICNKTRMSVTDVLERSVKSMALICGWVILFRIITGFLKQAFTGFVSECMITVITGFFELANGCVSLYSIDNDGLRFILASTLLSVGGLCVVLQTATAADGLSIQRYITGKCIQGLISTSLALLVQYYIFSSEHCFFISASTRFIGLMVLLGLTFFIIRKIIVAFPKKVVYN